MKKLKIDMEFSSITGNPKWLIQLIVHNFNSRRPADNERFIRGVVRLIKKYNGGAQ